MNPTLKPRVLAVSSEVPWPLNTGGHLRTFHVLKALAGNYDVRLLVPSRGGDTEAFQALSTRGIRVVPVPVPPRSAPAELKRLFRARFLGDPYAMYRRHALPEMFAAFTREFQNDPPDLIHLDHLDGFLFHEIADRANVPAVLDLHNVYSLILERMAEEAGNVAKRWFYRGEAKRLAKIERKACLSGAAVVAVSEGEAAYFRTLGAANVTVAPNGVDCSAFASLPTGRLGNPPTILFLGTLSWGPNASAAIHLARHIFPQVREHHPDARLLLVGKSPNSEVLALSNSPGVTVAGSVPSIQPYLAEASLLAVPLDSGGGTRLKILEAFAAGLPVVSTAVGAEGIEAVDGRDLLIAERPRMSRAIGELLENPERGTAVAECARRLAREKYDWSVIGRICVELTARTMRGNGDKSRKIDQTAQAQPTALVR